jgi:hypothetical protein
MWQSRSSCGWDRERRRDVWNQELTRQQFRRKRKGTGDDSEGGCADCKGGLGKGGGKRERCGGTKIRSVQMKSTLVRWDRLKLDV